MSNGEMRRPGYPIGLIFQKFYGKIKRKYFFTGRPQAAISLLTFIKKYGIIKKNGIFTDRPSPQKTFFEIVWGLNECLT